MDSAGGVKNVTATLWKNCRFCLPGSCLKVEMLRVRRSSVSLYSAALSTTLQDGKEDGLNITFRLNDFAPAKGGLAWDFHDTEAKQLLPNILIQWCGCRFQWCQRA